MSLHATWGVHPKSFIRRGFLEGDISSASQSRWFRHLNGTHRNRMRTLRSPFPLQPTGIGSLLDLMKSVGWTAPSLARDLHVHVTELAAVLEALPFPSASLQCRNRPTRPSPSSTKRDPMARESTP